MTIPSVVSLVDDITRTTFPAKLRSVGEYVGRFGKFGPHCWELRDSFRDIYCTEIRPLILAHLGGRIGSVANQGSITITAYMIGRRANTAAPTVLFVSDSENHRKEARKLIKESGIIGQHHGWKTAQASRDPSWGGKLEQLASGLSSIDTTSRTAPATQVFYNPLQLLRSQGMTLYVSHESGLRVFTANLVRAHGDAYYQGPAHAFFDRAGSSFKSPDESLDDFEIDSDDDTETVRPEDEMAADSIEFDCQDWSSDEESDESGVSSAEDSDDDNFSQSSFEMDRLDHVRSSERDDPFGSCLSQPQNMKVFHPAPESIVPSLDSLLPFGTLDQWSLSKDWALVKVTIAPESPIPAFLDANPEDLSTLRVAQMRSTRASVVVYTTSHGRLTGTITGTTSDTRVPFGTSFEEVFSVKLNGPLADGDCGSVVIDTATGELYGHIVAGCRATGFAHVMAAFHTMPELGKIMPTGSTILNGAEFSTFRTTNDFGFESYMDLDGTLCCMDCALSYLDCSCAHSASSSSNMVVSRPYSAMLFSKVLPPSITPATFHPLTVQADLEDSYLPGLSSRSPNAPPRLSIFVDSYAPASFCGPLDCYGMVVLRSASDHHAHSRWQRACARNDQLRAWFNECVTGDRRNRSPHQEKEIFLLQWGHLKDLKHKQKITAIRTLFKENLHVDVRFHVIQILRSGYLQAKAASIATSHAPRCEDLNGLIYIYKSGQDADVQSKPTENVNQGRAISRQDNKTEEWALYDFQMHTRKCAYCYESSGDYFNHDHCECGYRLAQEVASYTYEQALFAQDLNFKIDHAYIRFSKAFGSCKDTYDMHKHPVSTRPTIMSLFKEVLRSRLPFRRPTHDSHVLLSQGYDRSNYYAVKSFTFLTSVLPCRFASMEIYTVRADTFLATALALAVHMDSISPTVLEAARATSAAPNYFAPISHMQAFVNGGQYVLCGGMCYNNPTAVSIPELNPYPRANPSTTSMTLTIGTGRSSTTRHTAGLIKARDESIRSLLGLTRVSDALDKRGYTRRDRPSLAVSFAKHVYPLLSPEKHPPRTEVVTGNLAVVERLLQEKADIHAIAQHDGKTAFEAAAEGGVVTRMTNNPGDWIYDYEHQRYYRYTTNANGQPECLWAPAEENAQNEGQQAQASQEMSQAYTNYKAAAGARPRYDSTQPEMAPPAPDTISHQLRFRGTPHLGWYDRLDPSYRIRERREAHEFFRAGRVFAIMLWAESASATMTRGGTENTAVTIRRFGEEVFSQIRRFVVVKTNRRRHFVYACAISTYNRQGTLKRGCNAAEHTIVHLEGTTPTMLEGEWERGMTKEPIMIIPTDPQEFMEPTSRLRCGRIYSIEWKVKLKDIGMVADHDRNKLRQYFDQEQDNGFDLDEDELGSQPQQYYCRHGQ